MGEVSVSRDTTLERGVGCCRRQRAPLPFPGNGKTARYRALKDFSLQHLKPSVTYHVFHLTDSERPQI